MEAMIQNHKKNEDSQASANVKIGKPTLFDFLGDVQLGMANSMNLAVKQKPAKSRRALPKWSEKIIDGFRKTIFKPILKLKPKRKMDWQNYGKIIGVLDRQVTFFTIDIPRIIKEDGWNKITSKQWDKIWLQMGGDQLLQEARQVLIKALNRPVADDEPLEKLAMEVLDQSRQQISKFINRPVSDDEPLEELAMEVLEQPFKNLAMHKQIAFQHVSQQSAKNNAKFLKGMAQGYSLFLDEQGDFCGDRGRANIQLELLSSQREIEKMRRVLPARSLSNLQNFVGQSFQFHPDPEKSKRWFKDVCDDICLSMKGRGRPHKFVKPQMAPSF
jgi:hypothetical protein